MSETVFKMGRKTPRVFSGLIGVVALLVGFAIFWAHETALPEIVRASGQISPRGQLQNVGHYDGGVVDRISVRPGDEVAFGDVLAVVRKPDIEAEITRLQRQITVQQGDVARLEAMNAFLRRDLDQPGDPAELSTDWASEWSGAQQYQVNQIETYLSRRSALSARAQRAKEGVGAAKRVSRKVAARVESLTEREARAQDLLNRGLATIASVERETDILEQVRSEALQAEIRVIEAEDRYSETLADIENARIDIQRQMQEELYRARIDLQRQETELALNNESMARAKVLANADGTVQTVHFTARGEIVSQGATIVDILPADDRLVAKVRLSPADIGHIQRDTPVRLSLTTFDVRRYGHIEGEIEVIAPTSEMNDRGEPFFEVVVHLSRDYVEADSLRKSLRAGMEVSAEFISEQRSVLEYFIGPMQAALASAFTERG